MWSLYNSKVGSKYSSGVSFWEALLITMTRMSLCYSRIYVCISLTLG
jgi:hypothetical protein